MLPLANIWKTSDFKRYYNSIMLNKETLCNVIDIEGQDHYLTYGHLKSSFEISFNVYQSYTNGDPGLTLTYLTSRSILLPLINKWENILKYVIFREFMTP